MSNDCRVLEHLNTKPTVSLKFDISVVVTRGGDLGEMETARDSTADVRSTEFRRLHSRGESR